MAFKGTYQFVEVEVHEDEEQVYIATLDERRAANPNTVVGAIVDFDNQIDRILVVGDDAYRMGKMPLSASETPPHEWHEREGFGRYYIEKKPDGTATIIMDMLNAEEK